VETREIFHTVLEISHVSEEVFREFFDGLDCWCRGNRRSGRRICVGIGGDGGGWGRVPSYKGGNQDGEEKDYEGENGK